MLGFYASFILFHSGLLYYVDGIIILKKSTIAFCLLGILTAPVWYLSNRRFGHFSLTKRILIQLAAFPFLITAWAFIFFKAAGVFNYSLSPQSELIWEIYTPCLFYFIQFGIFNLFDYYFRFQKQKQIEAELKQLALQSEILALRSQMQPHFLFNTLNSISASLPKHQEVTRNLISRFADTMRYALSSSERAVVSIEEELYFIKTYLFLEKARFKERLIVEYEVEPAAMSYSIPPFLMQPLVENAIKHAVSISLEPITIRIGIFQAGDKLKFIVSDTGCGTGGRQIDALLQKGVGLRNTAQTLLKLYGSEIKTEPNIPSGASFYFYLPVKDLKIIK